MIDDDIMGRLPSAGDEEAATPGVTPLDTLRAELADIDDETVDLEVPKRPGWAVRVSTTVRYDKLMGWRKQATSKSNVNELRLAALALANQNTAIVRNGDDLADDDGELYTFRSRGFKDLLGADDAVEAVIRLYGNEFHVLNAANRLLVEAGYADGIGAVEDDEEGPTTR